MPAQVKCPDDPPTILKQRVCISPLSKNMRGQLKLRSNKEETCRNPSCKSLKTLHLLKVMAVAHRPCDSRLGRPFSGTILVEKLITSFDQDGMHRGFHAGDFA